MPPPVPPPQPGRRDNGLAAADWGALVDVDPRLSRSLLDRLAEAGVAAYVEPAGGVDALHRGVTMPDRPLDRLWVDADRAEAARTVVSALTGDLGSEDARDVVRPVPRGSARRVLPPPVIGAAPDPLADDEAFARIVAGFDTEDDSPVPRWPAQEDLGGRTAAPPLTPVPEERTPHRRGDDLPDWVEPDELEPEAEDHFVPPPPPPLRGFRATTIAYLLSLLLGVLVTFAPDLLGLSAGNDTRLLGMVLMGAGALMLVWQMHDGSVDDDPDEGAVV